MAALNHASFSKVFLATLVLVLGGAHAAVDSPFCSKADPGAEKALCNNLVNGARSWDLALSNVIHAALQQALPAKALIDNLDKKFPASLRPISKDSIKQTCNEAFSGVLDGFNGALKNIRTGDRFKSINSQLSAALSSFSDCTDGLNEFGVDSSDVQRFQDSLAKYASLSLAVSHTKRQ